MDADGLARQVSEWLNLTAFLGTADSEVQKALVSAAMVLTSTVFHIKHQNGKKKKK